MQVVKAGGRVRQTRIGLCEHRQAAGGAEPLHQRQDLGGAQRAVDTHRVRAKALRGHRKALHLTAGEGAAGGLKGHGGHHRQITGLLRGQDARLYLQQVGHGLKVHRVRTGGGARRHHLLEQVAGLLEGQGAHGLEHLAQGADVQQDLRIGTLGSCFGALHRGGDHLGHCVAAARQLLAVGAESVGADEIGASLQIGFVDAGHHLRMGHTPHIRDLAGRKARLLQHGSHGPVQNPDAAFVKQFIGHRVCPPFVSYRYPAGRR